jgi:hypothetical protein
MPVDIQEISSTVRMVDGDNLLEPRTLQRIVQLVIQAMEDRERHEQRAAAERGVPRGVARQQEQGD